MKYFCCLICFLVLASSLGAIDPNSNVVLEASDTAAKYSKQVEASHQEVSFMPVAFIYMLLGAGAIWVGWRYFRNNGMLPGRDLRDSETARVRVLGSKPLGNKQNLLVVEFEGRRLLLGVGPNFISYLTDATSTGLDAPPEFLVKEEPEPNET